MKTYTFKVALEPDEDFDGNPSGWHAFCPVLEKQGASTWGATGVEALRNIDSVIHMVVESMLEHGSEFPKSLPAMSRSPSNLAWPSRVIRGH
jgi:predicted RNase H-like HicB family nuclease